MVANKIYATTHDGLTQLVSTRVASQVLDNALRTANCSAETVSAKEMGKVLKGPVLRELATILPRSGLERSLKKLLKTLHTLAPDEATESTAIKGTVSENAAPEATLAASDPDPSTSFELIPGSDPDAEPEQTGYGAPNYGAPNDDSSGERRPCRHAAVSAAAPDAVHVLPAADSARLRRASTTLGPTARDDLLLAFAQLEHVEMVAAFEKGSVTAARGSGFDLAALSRLGTLGLKLLSRSGELRTFYVAHSRGQLFLFPFGEVTLMLIGSAELNLGLVFATLHKFKEEL